MIKRELVIFFIVGALTVLFDYICYRGLIRFQFMEVGLAKAISFMVGTLFAYFVNRFWTFAQERHVPGSSWRFLALYSSTLCANVLINAFVLKLLADVAIGIQLAFLLATGVSACLNFLGMKLFVFKPILASELR